MEARLLTVEDIAATYRVSVTTVRRWIKSGRLKGSKVGSQWRFDEAEVNRAFKSGILSLESEDMSLDPLIEETPDWARPVLDHWRNALIETLRLDPPDFVIVSDRRGAKVWSLLKVPGFQPGRNLWHSNAIERMTDQELEQIFSGKKGRAFDEMIQRGRRLRRLRERLEGVQAEMTTFVCVRREASLESGELEETKATVAESLGNKEFADRAALISRLATTFPPPLDSHHPVVVARLATGLTPENLLENLAAWGIPFVIWTPDGAHRHIAITLDRPQFFETTQANRPGFKFDWTGPCKVRLYLRPDTGECYISFIVFPNVSAPTQSLMDLAGEKLIRADEESVDKALSRGYSALTLELALQLLENFISSGAASTIGIKLDQSAKHIDADALKGHFGPRWGSHVAKRMQEILTQTALAKIPRPAATPVPRFITSKGNRGRVHDAFKCRTEFLAFIPSDRSPGRPAPSYYEILNHIDSCEEAEIGRVLDYEIDMGTVKPDISIRRNDAEGSTAITRVFYRGEYGSWFESRKDPQTNIDLAIQKTLGLCPVVMARYLERVGKTAMTGTEFNKVFTNLQHDFRSGAHDQLYVGWVPYKFGPIAVVKDWRPFTGHQSLDGFLVEREGIVIERKDGEKLFRPNPGTLHRWQELHDRRVSSLTKAHAKALVRLYAAIQVSCKTQRPAPGGYTNALLGDPLVVLAAARNNETAYRCAWFEVDFWKSVGQRSLLPLLKISALLRGEGASLTEPIKEFALAARLAHDKVEMYRNLPFLREQIVKLAQDGDYDVADVLLETIDREPAMEATSKYPMATLAWASEAMRSFSSLLRQILANCGLSEKETPQGRPASDYLSELFKACPELQPLEPDLKGCIVASEAGKLTERGAETLSMTFNQIVDLLEARLPDPRLPEQRGGHDLRTREDLVAEFARIRLPTPNAIGVVDVRNLQGLPKLGQMLFNLEYDKGFHGILDFVDRIRRVVELRHPAASISPLVADNVIIAHPTVEGLEAVLKDFMVSTTLQVRSVDRQLIPLGLLRGGIAWNQGVGADGFAGIRPGLIAYGLADLTKQEPGTISITNAALEKLPPDRKSDYLAYNTNLSPDLLLQGPVFRRPFDQKRDLGSEGPK